MQQGTGTLDYVKYDEQRVGQQDFYKSEYNKILMAVGSLRPGRAKSLALTKLEESYMWVGKALRDEQIADNGSAPLQEERKDG